MKKLQKLLVFLFCLTGYINTAQTTQTFTSSGTFTVPIGVTTMQVEAWGGGGAGGGVNGSFTQTRAGGGGSGGAYVKNATLTVTPGATINYTVGSGGNGNSSNDGGNGGASIFSSVTANGGNGGKLGTSGQQFGPGGAAVTGTFNGGAGAAAASNNSGGGGGSAGSSGNGGNASGTTGGAAGAGGGGAGANGLTSNNNGTDATNIGAGGSGGRSSSSTDRSGGDGFRGQIKITYTCPSYVLTSPATATGPFCGASATVVTLRSSSMQSGTYQVTYNLAGANTATGSTASMTFSSGSGSGTFTTSSLANAGTTNIVVTNISSSVCNSPTATNNAASAVVTAAPTAVAGTAITTCETSPAVNITAGSSSSNNAGILWSTSNGTGTFANATSLTTCTYLPSAADIAAGSLTLVLTATGNGTCGNAVSTKTITINHNPTAVAGTAINTCATTGAVNITAGASASNQASVTWTSNGTGTFSNANSLTNCTYTPSAADIAAGSRTLTLTANALSGCTNAVSSKTITIHAAPGAPGVITGAANVCGTLLSGLTYSIPSVSNATNYTWTVPTGWNITSGQGTNSIVVTSGNNGQNGNITVAASNTGCAGTNPTTTVNIYPNVGTHNTGYTTSSAKTSGDIQCNSTTLAGYVKFPLNNVPSGSTITSSVLSLVNNNSTTLSTASNDIRALGNNDPLTASASNLYTAATSGTSYSSAQWSNNGTVNLTLNSSANTDIQNRIVSPGYIAMGLDRGGSATYIFHGFNAGANAPKLAVTFTGPRTLAVTVAEAADLSASSNAPVCDGVSVNFSAINNAPGQSTGNTFSWTGPNGFTSTQQNPNLNNCTSAQSGNYTVVITNQFLCTASAVVSVAVNPNPSLAIGSQSNITCNGFADGAYTLNATSGTSPYLFTDGSNFNLDGIFTGLDVGTYFTTVYDANGCFSELPVAITQPDVLSLNSTNNSPICEGTSLNFAAGLTGGTTPYSISWSGPNGFTSSTDNNSLVAANPLATGNYVLSVVDANGCLQGTTMSLTVDQAAIVNAGSDQSLCNPTAVSVLGSIGGSASSTLWTTSGDGTFSDVSNVMSDYIPGANDLANGIVTLTLTSNSNGACSAGIDNLVSKLHSGLPAAPGAINSVASVCPPVNGVALSVAPYLSADSYLWQPGPGQNGITFVGSTSNANATVDLNSIPQNGYTIRVYPVNACGVGTAYSSTYIRRAVSTPLNPSGPTVACQNTVKTYTIPAVTGAETYTWTAPSGGLINGNASPYTTNLTSVDITFPNGFTSGQVGVAANVACFTTITKNLNVSTATVSVGAITGATYTVCPGQSYTYSVAPVNGAFAYNWVLPNHVTGTSSSNSITVAIQPGFSSANIRVSATSVCGVASAQQQKTISTGTPSRPASLTGPTNGVCGQTVVNTCPSQPGTTYNWTVPASASIINGQGSNAISVTYGTFSTGTVCVSAVNGCGSSQSRCITVSGAPATPAAVTAIPGSWCANTAGVEFDANVSNLSGNYTLSWMYPGSNVATYVLGGGNSTSLILDWKTGSGNVIVTASNACGNGSRIFYASNSCRQDGETSSIENNSLNVYPNPAHGNLNVNFTVASEQNVIVKMNDISGRTVYTSTVNAQSGTNNTQLNVSKFANGIYTITVNTSEKSYQSRVVIE